MISFRPPRDTLLRDRGGAVAVEFAFVFPVMLLMIFAILEFAMIVFVSMTIENAVFEAARFGVVGSAGPTQSREERVLEIVEERTYGLVDMDDVEITTNVYASFADIGQPEPFTDTNADGVHSAGEPFADINGNGTRDLDMGRAGLGGPSDIVVYRLSYPWGVMTRLMSARLGDSIRNVSSIAVRNEPF